MYNFLVILLLIDALILGAAILLQAGKGGGLAASFGGAGSSPNSLLGSREAGNLLTKTSWTAGGVFLFLAFVLQIMSARGRTVRSVLDDQFVAPPAPTAPTGAPASVPLQSVPPTGGDTSKQQ
jgi:preprotein translocase subunit SecG